MKRTILLLVFSATLAGGRDKADHWIEVRSQHFSVVTNAGENPGRRVADQFERMRAVFHTAFPKMQIDPPAPIIVLAVKDERDFRRLEPTEYLAKGQVELAGLFLHAPDKNYVLMRLDAGGDHPYQTIYHEYTHLLLDKSAGAFPLWLEEGLAEFYQNTTIRDKDARIGEPSGEDLALLRQNHLLPLSTLFAVDQTSPYYHEEQKGTIFYAQSWALTHMILMKDYHDKTNCMDDYLTLLTQKVDPVAAASRAFGDSKKLESALEEYVRRAAFTYFKITTAIEVDDSGFKMQSLRVAQADAFRADFLAYNNRPADAHALLDRVLKDDPQNVSACETNGYLAFTEGRLAEARKWYQRAVQLDSRSYLADYYFAAMAIREGGSSNDAQIESSLRQAIKLNPWFAPSFDELAVFLGNRNKNLDEAYSMELTAVSLDPANVHYRINLATLLTMLNRGPDAIEVLHVAEKIAKTPAELKAVDDMLMRAQVFAASGETQPDGDEDTDNDGDADVSTRDVAKRPHLSVTGVLKNVQCKSLEMDLTVSTTAKNLMLHSENYYEIHFTTLNFTPEGDLNPCKDLEGRPAKVEYVDSTDQSMSARVLSIELHK